MATLSGQLAADALAADAGLDRGPSAREISGTR